MNIIAENLRVGNLVDCLGMCEVVSISKNKIKINRFIGDGEIEVEKIPLNSFSLTEFKITEQWLLDFGFKYNSNTLTYDLNDFIINRDFTNPETFTIDLYCSGEELILETVNQLQNLYYTNTGGVELKYLDRKKQSA